MGGLDTIHGALKSAEQQNVAIYLISLAETHDFVFLTKNNIVQSFESIIQTDESDDQKWDDIVLSFVRFLCRPELHPEYKMSADDFESSLKKLTGAHEKERLHKLREIYYDDYEYTLVNWLELGSSTV